MANCKVIIEGNNGTLVYSDVPDISNLSSIDDIINALPENSLNEINDLLKRNKGSIKVIDLTSDNNEFSKHVIGNYNSLTIEDRFKQEFSNFKEFSPYTKSLLEIARKVFKNTNYILVSNFDFSANQTTEAIKGKLLRYEKENPLILIKGTDFEAVENTLTHELTHLFFDKAIKEDKSLQDMLTKLLEDLTHKLKNYKSQDPILEFELLIEHINHVTNKGKKNQNEIFAYLFQSNNLYNYIKENYPKEFNELNNLMKLIEPTGEINVTGSTPTVPDVGNNKNLNKNEPKKSKFIFNNEQQDGIDKAKDFILNGDPNKFMVIEGKAGTGKTTIIPEFLEDFSDKEIAAVALSNKAKSVIKGKLFEAGVSAKDLTIAKLLGLKENYIYVEDEDGYGEWKSVFYKNTESSFRPPIKSLDIIIIDEASMINEEFLEMIMKEKLPHAKVIFLGDIGQLAPIREESVGYYSESKNKKYLNKKSPVFDENNSLLSKKHKVKLLTRIRQGEDSPILEFADYAWNESQNIESPEQVMNIFYNRANNLNKTGAIFYSNNYQNIKKEVLEAFKHGVNNNLPNYIKFVAFRNKRVNEINKEIHNYLFGANSPIYNEGELMIFTKNLNERYENSTEFRISGKPRYIKDHKIQYGSHIATIPTWVIQIEIFNPDGSSFIDTIDVIDPEYKSHHTKFLNEWADYINNTGAKKEWRNFYAVKNYYADIDYSYAITSHKSQGSTYDNVIVDEQDINSVTKNTKNSKNESLYTALTRSRNSVIVISDKPVKNEKIPSILELNEQINSSKNGINFTKDEVEETQGIFEAEIENKQNKKINNTNNEIIELINNPAFNLKNLSKYYNTIFNNGLSFDSTGKNNKHNDNEIKKIGSYKLTDSNFSKKAKAIKDFISAIQEESVLIDKYQDALKEINNGANPNETEIMNNVLNFINYRQEDHLQKDIVKILNLKAILSNSFAKYINQTFGINLLLDSPQLIASDENNKKLTLEDLINALEAEAEIENIQDYENREKPFSVQIKTQDFDKMMPHLQWDNEKKTFKNIDDAQKFFEQYKDDEIGLANVWSEAEEVTTPMQVMTIKAGDLVRLPSLDYLKMPKPGEVGLFGPAEKSAKLISRQEIIDKINNNLSDLVKYRASIENKINEWNKYAKTKIPALTDEVFEKTINNQIEYKSKYYNYTPINGQLVGEFSETPNTDGKKYLNIKPNYIVGRVFHDKINNKYKAYVAIKFKNQSEASAMLIDLDPKYITSIRRMNSDFRQEIEYENGQVKLDVNGNPLIKEKSAKYDVNKLSKDVINDATSNLQVLNSITGELNGLEKNSLDPLMEKYTTKKGNTIYRSTPHGIMISGFYGNLSEPLKEASTGDYIKYISKRVGKSVVSEWGVKLMNLPGGILVLTPDGSKKVVTANNSSTVVFNKSNLTKYLKEVGDLVDETKTLTFKQKQNDNLNKDFSIYPFWVTEDAEKRKEMAKTLKKGDYVKIMFKNKEGNLIEFVAPILFVTDNKIYYGTSKIIETVNGKNSNEKSEEKVNSINSIDIATFTEGKWNQKDGKWSFTGYDNVNQPFIRAAYVDHREHRQLLKYMTEYLKDIEDNKKNPWEYEEKQYIPLEDLTNQLTGSINNPQNKLQKMSLSSEWSITNFEDDGNIDVKSRKLAGLIPGDLVKTSFEIGENDKKETRYKWGMVVGQDERTLEPIVAIFTKAGKLMVRKRNFDSIVGVGERSLPIYLNPETGEYSNYKEDGLISLSEGRPDQLKKLEKLYSEFFEKGLKTVNLTNDEYIDQKKLIETKFKNHEKVPLVYVKYKDSDLKGWVLNFDNEKHEKLEIKDSPEKQQVYRIRRKIGDNYRDIKNYQMVSGHYSLYNANKASFDDIKKVVSEGDTMTLEVITSKGNKIYVPGIVTEINNSAIQISAVRKNYNSDSQETTYSTDTYTWFKPSDKYPNKIRVMELNGSNKSEIIQLGQKLHNDSKKTSKDTKKYQKSFDNRETINLIGDKLSNLYNVETTLLTNDEMISLGQRYKADFSNVRAFALTTGKIFINIDKASIAEPLHELAHIIMPGLKAKNPKAYNELLSRIKDHPSYWDIAEHYPELSEEDLDEEVFVTIFAEYFREKMISNEKNEWLSQDFKDLTKNVSSVLSDIFDNDTRGDAGQLMNMSLEEIMNQFGFELISGRFAQYYSLAVQLAIKSKVQQIKYSLIKEGKLKEIC